MDYRYIPEEQIVANVIATTATGEVDSSETKTIALYELDEVVKRRDTARLAVADTYIHVDVYPAEGQSKGAVAFVGGLSSHAMGYAGFQHDLSLRGWNVVALDLRGHGRSGGKRGEFSAQSAIEDMQTALHYAAERFGGPVQLMGSSLGGFYALLGANALPEVHAVLCHWIFLPDMPVQAKDARTRKMALFLNRIAPWAKLNTLKVAEWDAVCETAEMRQKLFDDPLMVWKYSVRSITSTFRYTPPHPLTELQCPTLVVIGEKDGMTPMDYTQRVYDKLVGEKEFVVIPEAGHMGGLIEHRAEMLDACDAWFTKQLKTVKAAPTERAPA